MPILQEVGARNTLVGLNDIWEFNLSFSLDEWENSELVVFKIQEKSNIW